MSRARDLLKHYPDDLAPASCRREEQAAGRPTCSMSSPGPDLDKLNLYAQTMVAKLKQIPDVADADTSLVFGKPELRVEIDRQRAADLGVRVNDIAHALNTMVAGQVVSTFPSGGEAVRCASARRQQFRTSVEGLSQLTVFSTNKHGWVPLDQVVRIKSGTAPSSIGRLNRQRQVTSAPTCCRADRRQK